jgi:uncharacterized membrane protein YhaH (DUF805 family)
MDIKQLLFSIDGRISRSTFWLCVYGKRWHDRDKSAWWILIGLIPFIGWIWVLVEVGFLKGTDGPNRFGEDPVPGA